LGRGILQETFLLSSHVRFSSRAPFTCIPCVEAHSVREVLACRGLLSSTPIVVPGSGSPWPLVGHRAKRRSVVRTTRALGTLCESVIGVSRRLGWDVLWPGGGGGGLHPTKHLSFGVPAAADHHH